MNDCNVLVIGGGIVGLATAHEVACRYPERRVVVLEKEGGLAQHQTGRNSGVMHSGIYYKPGSEKARNCRVGKARLEAFCAQEGIPHSLCGKVIVATAPEELPRLEDILARGLANGVRCERIGPERLRELEPHCMGIAAIHVPEAGIVDYTLVCLRLAERIVEGGAMGGNAVVMDARVQDLSREGQRVVVSTTQGDYSADLVINCAGLQSDRVASFLGGTPQAQIVPFRGDYFELKPEAEPLCRGLIYPVPDSRFPFLGVHFTRMITGGVECGPNAVLALAREGYRKTDIDLRDAWQTLTYPGFQRLARRYARMGLEELWRSLNKAAFVRALQRLVPDIRAEHLIPASAGVRAQAVSPDGNLVDDFAITTRPGLIDVINAPSPAATAALSIAATIVDRVTI